MDKNREKIEKPKGESGSRGYSGTMYWRERRNNHHLIRFVK
jgi:hypothetical protein